MQATGKAAKAPKPKAAAKPAAAAGKGKGKDSLLGPPVDAAAVLEEEASLLAAVQTVLSGSAADATGAEERLKVVPHNQLAQPVTNIQLCTRVYRYKEDDV